MLLVVLAIGAAGCAARGAVPRPFPGAAPPPASAPAAVPNPETPELPILATALDLRGIPYRNGGSDLSGFDCSGFVQYVFARHGFALPREVREQFHVGTRVSHDDVQPGDLVFFETEGSGASHVGIALDGERFVHAPSSRGVVRVESYKSEYWSKRYVGARRAASP